MTATLTRTTTGVYDDDHEAFRESVRTHLERTVVPEAEAWDGAGGVPDEALAAAAEHGFVATGVAEAHGGLGIDDVRFTAVVVEEAMRLGLDAFALVAIAHGDLAVRALGDDARAGGLATGELRAAVALHPGHDGARGVVGAAQADVLVLADGDDVRVVDLTAPGVEVRAWDAPVGLRAAGLADVTLSGDAAEAVSGASLTDLRRRERVLLGVAGAAGARAALEVTVAYVAERQAFGTPIASFGNTHQAVGSLAAELAAADALVAATLAAEVDGTATDAQAAACALVATELHGRAVDAGVQLHGGYGYVMEYPIAHHYADARWLRLAGGGTPRLRETVAAPVLGALGTR